MSVSHQFGGQQLPGRPAGREDGGGLRAEHLGHPRDVDAATAGVIARRTAAQLARRHGGIDRGGDV